MKHYPALLAIALIFTSCISEIDKQLDSQHIGMDLIRMYPETSDISVKWSIYKNESRMEISFDKNGDEKLRADTLNYALYRVQVTFFDQQGVIRTLPGFARYSSSEILDKNGYFTFTQNLTYTNRYIIAPFGFPMYYFHSVPEGKQELYAAIVITRNDEANRSQVFKGFFRFTVDVPKIYRSTLICKGIELQSDSIWSPYHSDFSFGKGLPDIYWAVCMPATDSNDVSHLYASMPVLWNAYGYDRTDTVELLTYSENESLLLGVYDYDRVFSDEHISSVLTDLNGLGSKGTDFLHFQHVTRFSYDFRKPVCINCGKK